jgi:hypothetical protein
MHNMLMLMIPAVTLQLAANRWASQAESCDASPVQSGLRWCGLLAEPHETTREPLNEFRYGLIMSQTVRVVAKMLVSCVYTIIFRNGVYTE